MTEFLELEKRKASHGKFLIARIKYNREQRWFEVKGIGIALDTVKGLNDVMGPFRIYNHLGMTCHSGY